MQKSFPEKLYGILFLTRQVFLMRAGWVDLKYFQNSVVAEYCKTKFCLTFAPSSTKCCGPGSHLMKSVLMADCSRWLRKWQLVGGCPGQTQRNQTRFCWNLSWIGQKVVYSKVLQLKQFVLTPGIFFLTTFGFGWKSSDPLHQLLHMIVFFW